MLRSRRQAGPITRLHCEHYGDLAWRVFARLKKPCRLVELCCGEVWIWEAHSINLEKTRNIRKAVAGKGRGRSYCLREAPFSPLLSIFATLSRFSTFAPCLLYLSHASDTGTQGFLLVRASSAGAWSSAAGAVSLLYAL